MNRRYIFFVVLMIAVMFISPLKVSGDDEHDETHDIEHSCSFEAIKAQELEKARGLGLMCRTRHGVRAWLYVKSLVPGDAYTVWWVYFDDPTQCADLGGDCEDVGFGGNKPLGVFGRMDSSIAPHNGKLRFSGRIGGFKPSSGAQIWLWLFGHVPADTIDGRSMARRLLTPELPGAGAPHLGNMVDGELGFPAAVVKFDIP